MSAGRWPRVFCRVFGHHWRMKYREHGAFWCWSAGPYDCPCDRCGLPFEDTPTGAASLARSRADDPRVGTVIDAGAYANDIADTLSQVFKVARDRVEVRMSVGVEGKTPTLVLDLRLDGGCAPSAWLDLVNDIHAGARRLHAERLKLRAELQRLSAK